MTTVSFTAAMHQKYPEILQTCYDISPPVGWEDIVDQLLKELTFVSRKIEVFQIKEKFGGLRVYHRNPLTLPQNRVWMCIGWFVMHKKGAVPLALFVVKKGHFRIVMAGGPFFVPSMRKDIKLSENEAFTEEDRKKPSKYRLLLCSKDHSDLSTIRTEVENLYNEFCQASNEDFHRKYPVVYIEE